MSPTDTQILQSILDLVRAAGITERSELSVHIRVHCLTRAPNNFMVVYGNISRKRKQCIPGPPSSLERGLGTRLELNMRNYLLCLSSMEPATRVITQYGSTVYIGIAMGGPAL